MSRTFHNGERRLRIRGVRREQPDVRRLARALIDLAQAQIEAEAEHQHKAGKSNVVELPTRPEPEEPPRAA